MTKITSSAFAAAYNGTPHATSLPRYLIYPAPIAAGSDSGSWWLKQHHRWLGCERGLKFLKREIHCFLTAMYRSLARGITAHAARSVSRLSNSTPCRMASQTNAARRVAATTRHLRSYGALASTATSYPRNHEKLAQPQDTPWFVDNEFKVSSADQWIDLHDPATNNLVTRVPQSTDAELQAVVDSAQAAFPAWRATSVLARQQIMFKFVSLVRENWDRLAASITLEQGKTFADARGDVLRGLQVAEAACGAPELLKGEVLEVAKDMETRTYREPLGVTAAICPFSEFSLWKRSIWCDC